MRPLILAIEPDRQNALALRAIARRLGAELLLVDSVDAALGALAERTPDLVLIPALLSVRDELALTGRLRNLGDAAAHLQTLTIPMLEAQNLPVHGSMFATLRRDRPRVAGPDACETDTFAEQVGIYLERAAEARRRHAPAPAGPAAGRHQTPPDEPFAAEVVADAPATIGADAPGSAPAGLADSDLAAFLSEESLDLESLTLAQPPPSHAEPPAAPPLLDEAAMLDETLSDFVSAHTFAAPERATDAAADSRPAMDRWRFFDPERPRFAALLARLDEIAAGPA